MDVRNPMLAAVIGSAAIGLVACGGGGGSSDDGTAGDTTNDNGTATSVISGDITDLTSRGDWGGLVVDGNGEVNSADSNNNVASEAVPDGETRYFGGTDNSESSGYIRHLIIAESGYAFRADQEVQGLTLEGVGSGSDASDGGPFIDYLQVLGSEDDGIEWFGGAAGGKHIVINGQDDDGLDQDLGWQGQVQYALIRMGENNGDRAMETDGNGDDFDATPYTMPTIANLTVLGNQGKPDKSTMGALHREGYRGNIHRAVYIDDNSGFDAGCVGIDEMSGSSWQSDQPLTYEDVVCQAGAGELAGKNTAQENTFMNGSYYDVTMNPGATIDGTTLAIKGLNGGNIDGTLPSGMDDTDYYGAVDPNGNAWWDGWTYRNSNVDGNLPGSDFHPLEAEVNDGTIAPAASANCAVGAHNGSVDVFGKSFPVCEVSRDINQDVTLTNDHVYLLNETINVGDGGAESGPSGSNSATLTVEAGTQIMGANGFGADDVALVITRGSKIHVDGTADMPVIMGAASIQ